MTDTIDLRISTEQCFLEHNQELKPFAESAFQPELSGRSQRTETTELANGQGSVRHCRFRWRILGCHLRDTT